MMIFLPELVVIGVATAIFACLIVCYLAEERRRTKKLQEDMARYWAVCELNVRREAASSLDYQRRRAKAETFYRQHGYYP